MRQPISWSALADASVGVWGLGVEGQASLRRLRAMGRDAVLVDDAPAAPTLDGLEVLATAAGGLDALGRCDVVVKGPGISRYRPEVGQLEEAGVAVCGGLGLFMAEADPSRVACITGTKGKSTTTALAVHLLDRARSGRPGGRQHRGPALGPCAAARTRRTGSLRRPASRCPICRTHRRWWPSRRCRRTTWTGTGPSSATTPTSCRSAPSPVWRWPSPRVRTRSCAGMPASSVPTCAGSARPRWSGTPVGRRPSA